MGVIKGAFQQVKQFAMEQGCEVLNENIKKKLSILGNMSEANHADFISDKVNSAIKREITDAVQQGADKLEKEIGRQMQSGN